MQLVEAKHLGCYINGQRLKVFLEPSHKFKEEIDMTELIDFDKFI